MFNVGDEIVLIDKEQYNDVFEFLEQYPTKDHINTLVAYKIVEIEDDGIIRLIHRSSNSGSTINVYDSMREEAWYVWKIKELYNFLDNIKNSEHNTKYADVCRKIRQLYIKHNNSNQQGFKFNLGV